MGQTLQKAAEWTSAREGAGGKLEYTPANENILNKIIQFTEGFQGTNPEEAEIQFKSPLTWNSELNASHFSGGDYLVKDGDVESQKKGSDGATSLLVMRNKGQEKYEASVSSFEYLAKFLAACEGEKKVAETRLCLEANKDPIVQMLGDRFANTEGPDNSTYRYMEEILRAGGGGQQEEEGSGESKEKQQKMQNLRLLMLVRDFDQALLKEAVQTLSTEYRINPGEANRQLDLLRKYIGKSDTKHLLRSIAFTQGYDFQFNNGCYALPERQMNGDIYYIDVTPHDGETFCVTASTYGFFTNRGYSKEEKKLDFEREGEYYRDLMTLLREKSAKFNELVDKLVNFELHDTKEGQDSQSLTMDDDRRSQDGRTAKSRDQQRKGDDRKTADRKKKEGGEKKKKLEPSLKWKKLEVEKDDDEDEELKEKRRKQRAAERRKKRESQRIITSDGEESFEESSSESEEEEEAPERRQEANADLPSEYWQIQKLVKYLKGGNQTATIIALCAMRDFNLTQETCQLAIRDVGGLEVLINLLDTEEIKCKIGSLKILKEISGNTQIRRAIADLGGLETMVKILRDPNKDLKCLAAETIANVAKFRRARRTVRQHGGIKKLVGLLDNVSMTNVSTPEQQMDVEVARCGALALWSCSKSTRNKKAMRQAGAIPLLAKLLKSPHENMLIPVVGTLQECATESSYRLAIRTEGMIEDLVSNLKSENYELQMHCASAIFKCAEEKETRDLVRQYGGLDPLVSLLNNRDNKELLAAATGAIWKCSISKENVERFQELKAIDLLVGLLHDQPEEVLVNVVGALAELANDPPNRLTIRKAGGIPPLVTLLTGTNRALLVNDTKAVGQCAEEKDNMVVIDQLDGVRLIWSLLKNPDPEVQANAAWAICPCIENAKDAGEMVRSFVGGLELIVSLLKSNDKEVLASVCAAIANIANDEENLAVITDHGVVALLAKLTNTTEDKLRRHLAEAIARCCNWGNNRVAFGDAGAVAPLVKYLQSSELDVHTSTARALHQLSKDPTNCITMHEAGVVQLLMDMVGAADTTLQEAAAGCIANIRRLALTNEKNRTKPAQQQIQQ